MTGILLIVIAILSGLIVYRASLTDDLWKDHERQIRSLKQAIENLGYENNVIRGRIMILERALKDRKDDGK